MASAALPPFSRSFPWERVPTMAQSGLPGIFVRRGMTGTGRLDNKVLRSYADHYDLIVAGDSEPGKGGCLEPKVKDFADRIFATNPHATVLVYMASNIHHGSLVPRGARPDTSALCGLDNFKEEWIATLDNGSYVTIHGGKQYNSGLLNSRGPGGPTGPFCTQSRTPSWTLSR